ncbi:MAG: glycosyltransferase family 2 protein [Pseudolabrys sp.]
MSRIDIVVPCHNYARFLRQSVESVLEQSHRELRVLVIDDASTDETPAIAAELAERDSRVSFRRHTVNCGHILTYNEGIEWAESEYMLLLDADDFLFPGALKRAIDVLDTMPEIGLAWGPCIDYRDGDSLPIQTLGPVESGTEVLDATAFVRALAEGNCVPQSAAIVRTSVQKRQGGYLMELPHAGDLEMWVRFALHSKVVRVKTTQSAYRLHDSNMSRAYRGIPDFEQCRNVFRLHYRDIRDSLHNGAELETWIRRHYAWWALKWAKRALTQGESETCRKLLMGAARDVAGIWCRDLR